MGPELLRQLAEFWCMHPHSERAARGDRLSTRARPQRREQGALRVRHMHLFDYGEARRRALSSHCCVSGWAE
jgi:hypothetical protein